MWQRSLWVTGYGAEVNRYQLGEVAELWADFVDAAERPADPTTVTLVVTAPGGATTTYTTGQLINPRVGRWERNQPVTELGIWAYTFTGSGALIAQRSGAFEVTLTAPAYAQGPCQPWAGIKDVCDPRADDLPSGSLAQWIAVASNTLYSLTGFRWSGECTDVIFLTALDCMDLADVRYAHRYPHRAADSHRLRLPGYPVTSIVRVLIDGLTVPPARYRLEDKRYLVWLPEAAGTIGGWPTAEGWSVQYTYGLLPPPGGREAAAALGYQMALSCSPSASECRLPERVTSVTRQGVSYVLLDPLTLFDEGRTGLPEVDAWSAAMNRSSARRPAQLMIPGRRAAVHRRSLVTVPAVGSDDLDGGSPSDPGPGTYDGGYYDGVAVGETSGGTP